MKELRTSPLPDFVLSKLNDLDFKYIRRSIADKIREEEKDMVLTGLIRNIEEGQIILEFKVRDKKVRVVCNNNREIMLVQTL